MKFTKILPLVAVLSLSTSAFAQCGEQEATQPVSTGNPTIVDIAAGNESFSTLVAAVKAAGLAEALSGDGPFTVFAPTNEAFAKLPEGTVETLLKPENKAKLASILKFHVVSGNVLAKDAVKLNGAVSLQGQRIDFVVDDGGLSVDGARVVKTDIVGSNGVIHVIDSVILPTDKSIVETAKATGTFNTLLAAAKAAGLADTLATGGPFTVFAPTDDAFAKLPEGTVESLLKPENKEMLATILKMHVVSGRVYSETAVTLDAAPTLAGSVPVMKKDGALMIGGTKIVATDIDASNGVVHVIDAVILPQK